MTLAVDGAVALVTGGSRGIGKAIAIRLAEEGAQAFVAARPSDALKSTVAEIVEAGNKAVALPIDVTNPEDVKQAVYAVGVQFGRIDILVNNVGGAIKFGSFLELSDTDWQRAFELNVLSMMRFVRASLPLLERSQAPRIINISSISGIEPGVFNPHYTTTKAATINLSKALANSLKGILVNVICPGPVQSSDADNIPLGRIGDGKDIAGMVAFLASEDAAWITGSCFTVDGGKRRG